MDCLKFEVAECVATVTLARPQAHNAFSPALIGELTSVFAEASRDPAVRVVVLAAEGASFCAGADIAWMRDVAAAGFEENRADAEALARMFRTIYQCPRPVVARVQGHAYGGGAGLVAVCDTAVALAGARFCFSEVKLGLIPAVISPFVLRRLPPGLVRRLFVTAERFTAEDARHFGLVAEVAADEAELDARLSALVESLMANGPEAMTACKVLVEELAPVDWDEVLPLAARRIAERRASSEGQEGLRAFLEKRRPRWE